MSTLRVLHIDTEKTWRGGENQMRLLMQGSSGTVQSYLATPPDSIAAQKLKDIAKIIPLPLRGLALIPSAYKLAKLCRQESIPLIDCQTSKAHSLALLVKAFNPDIRIVVHRRVDYQPGKTLLNRRKYHSPSVAAYVPISHAIRDVLKVYGIPDRKIFTVRSAIDPQPFRYLPEDKTAAKQKLCAQLNIDPQIPLIANVAYHTPQKGIETLLEALALVATAGLPFHCLLAGDGPLTPQLKTSAKILRIDKHLHFLGIRNDIPDILAAADIFCLPSNFEGLGTSILEAIHSNCTVAASCVGGIPEMIEHGHNGLLSAVGDPQDLAANLKKLLQNPSLRHQFCQASRQIVQDKFSVEAMVEGNLAVYRQVLQQGAAQP